MSLPNVVNDDQVILLTFLGFLYVYGPDKADQAEEVYGIVEAAGEFPAIGALPAASWPRVREILREGFPSLEIYDMREVSD